jgi:hypothetical protein
VTEGGFAIVEKSVWYNSTPCRIEVDNAEEVFPLVCSDVEVVECELV